MRILWLLLFTLLAGCVSGPDDVVQFASQARSPSPEYPAVSRRMEEEGRVMLRVKVLASGNAGEVRLQESSGFDRLDAAAIAAVKKFNFNPARTRSGRAVDSWAAVPVHYILK